MRRVLASLSRVALGMAVLLATAAAVPSAAPSESAQPSESVRPSGSVAPSEPVSLDAQIQIWSVIADASSWDQVLGWQYGIVVTNGSANHDAVMSGESFTVTVPGESATVRITETLQDGFKLHKAYCQDPDQDAFEPGSFGTLDGATLSFDVKPGGEYICYFINGLPVQPDAQVFVYKEMDADGDLDTMDDFPLGVGWDFSIGVTNGTASHNIVTTDRNGSASFRVTAYAKLEITEVNSSHLLAGSCWDIMGEDPIHGGYTQDGATLAFETEPGGVYGCSFTNLGIGVRAETAPANVMAPPTDTLGGMPEPPSETWQTLLIGLAGLTTGVLVLTTGRSRRG
jgi:hypothetical protein